VLIVRQAFGEVTGVGQPPLLVVQLLLISVSSMLRCGPQEGHLSRCFTDASSLSLLFGYFVPLLVSDIVVGMHDSSEAVTSS
jgi:hypothetical protein